VLADGGELTYDATRIVEVGDRGVPEWVVYRRSVGEDGPAYELRIEVLDGIPVLKDVRVTARPGGQVRVKDVKLGIAPDLDAVITYWLREVTYERGDTAGHPEADWVQRFPVSDTERRAATKAVEHARRRARRKISDNLLRKTAQAYEAATEPFKHKAVAKTFDVSDRTAQRYIEKARDAGFLPPSERARK
jgi:hypothetical protein